MNDHPKDRLLNQKLLECTINGKLLWKFSNSGNCVARVGWQTVMIIGGDICLMESCGGYVDLINLVPAEKELIEAITRSASVGKMKTDSALGELLAYLENLGEKK